MASNSSTTTTRRRTTRKKKSEDLDVTETQPDPESVEEAPEEEKKKPVRRTRRRKADVEAEESVEAPPAEAEVEEKPKRRRTRRTTKKTEEKAESAPEPADDDFAAGLDDAPPPMEYFEAVPDARDEIDERDVRDDDERGERDERDDRNQRDDRRGGQRGPSNRNERANDDDEGGRGRRRRRRRRRGGRDNQNNNDNNRRGQRGGGGGRQQQQPQRSRQTRATSEEMNFEGTLEGVLELHPKGYGFLRAPEKNYHSQDADAFVSSSIVEKYDLREGILIRGEVGPGSRNQGPRLKEIETIDGRSVEEYQQIKHFDDLTPVNPFEQIKLETGMQPVTMRVMDLLTPIGKGQRALIVAPPRTGKTMLLHDIAHAVSENHPEMKLMVLLIDERPEEVTELKRNVKGEVIASSMDREVESHIRVSQLIIERAKRLAEAGGEVFVLLDSITRTARAFNKWVGNSGRTQTGGLDVKAMDIPRKMFGTARRFDEGGSLTILATALIDTGSRMDDAIFMEFKGTGNMELFLSRDLADRRIWPAIDISRSGTRREEKLMDPNVLETVTLLRRSLISLSPVEAMEELTRKLAMFPSNTEFLTKIRNVI